MANGGGGGWRIFTALIALLVAAYVSLNHQQQRTSTMMDPADPWLNFQLHIRYSHNMLRRAMEQLIDV